MTRAFPCRLAISMCARKDSSWAATPSGPVRKKSRPVSPTPRTWARAARASISARASSSAAFPPGSRAPCRAVPSGSPCTMRGASLGCRATEAWTDGWAAAGLRYGSCPRLYEGMSSLSPPVEGTQQVGQVPVVRLGPGSAHRRDGHLLGRRLLGGLRHGHGLRGPEQLLDGGDPAGPHDPDHVAAALRAGGGGQRRGHTLPVRLVDHVGVARVVDVVFYLVGLFPAVSTPHAGEGIRLVHGGCCDLTHACSSCPMDKHSGQALRMVRSTLKWTPSPAARHQVCRVLERFWPIRGRGARFPARALHFRLVLCPVPGRSEPRSLPPPPHRRPRAWAAPRRRRPPRWPPCAAPPPPRAPAPCAPARRGPGSRSRSPWPPRRRR